MPQLIALTAFLASTTTAFFIPPSAHAAADIDTAKGTPEIRREADNKFFWPDRLDLGALRQFNPASSPLGAGFDYAREFNTLDLTTVKADIAGVIRTSQDWWPADYGTYAPFFIRMAWHSGGTYRTGDGRGGAGGGQQRFEPINSWADNANLDKARRLLLPVKLKYGRALSWSDLMVLTGNVALESMGVKTYGFAGGRVDDWEPDAVYWGHERKMLGDERYHGDRQLEKPLAAVQMGLIYVNPQGPNGNPDPQLSANDIRETFGRMAMGDEETVALIAGGHTFGKAHGAAKDPDHCLGQPPAGAPIEEQGTGWNNRCGTGTGADATTSGLEGAWSATPTQWSNQYLTNLYAYDWEKTKSPSGAWQWTPTGGRGAGLVPDAHDPTARHAPFMFTSDIALKVDPDYDRIARRFAADPAEFQLAFAKAWFKLTHRDMGPRTRYLGSEVPQEDFLWQDPVPPRPARVVDAAAIDLLKSKIRESGLTGPELIRTAWASAASFRSTDNRGGANGSRIRLAPEKDWPVNNPPELARVVARLEAIRAEFGAGAKVPVSLADLVVLAGATAVEDASRAGGVPITIPFTPGRTDATQDMTDVHSFSFLEPKADGFRNYYGADESRPPTESLVDRASLLGLSVPEMAVLVAGLRVLGANSDGSMDGVLTARVGTLSPDFFVNLLDMSTRWQKIDGRRDAFEGLDRATGQRKWTATSVDLIFGSQSELRAISEFYAARDARAKFADDFARAWNKVMMLDRFDLN